MTIATELENLALGEVTLEQGAKTVRTVLGRLDANSADSLYEALRSWIWKALEARRRDDELTGWMDIFSRASSHMESVSADLALKIEAFIELLQASVMTAAAATQQDPFERKHVRSVLAAIYRSEGRMRRGDLMNRLGLKAPNMSRVMIPLLDDGYVVREVDGREIFYRLTLKGRSAIAARMAHELPIPVADAGDPDDFPKIVAVFPVSQIFDSHEHQGPSADPFQKHHTLLDIAVEEDPRGEHLPMFGEAQTYTNYGYLLRSEEHPPKRLSV